MSVYKFENNTYIYIMYTERSKRMTISKTGGKKTTERVRFSHRISDAKFPSLRVYDIIIIIIVISESIFDDVSLAGRNETKKY